MAKWMVCTQCETVGKPKKIVSGSMLMEIVLWLCLIIPGLLYSLWRSTSGARRLVCRECGSDQIVPVSSPAGRRITGS